MPMHGLILIRILIGTMSKCASAQNLLPSRDPQCTPHHATHKSHSRHGFPRVFKSNCALPIWPNSNSCYDHLPPVFPSDSKTKTCNNKCRSWNLQNEPCQNPLCQPTEMRK